MNILKKMALAASLFFVSGFASAAVYDLGTIGPGVNVNQNVAVTASGFNDSFLFTLEQDLTVGFSANPDLTAGFLDIFGPATAVSNFALTLFNSAGDNLGSAVEGVDGIFRTSGLLQAGDYTGVATGDWLGGFTGYSMTVSASAPIAPITSPIPEASTIAMMLGGLGLVGFMARRRKAA